MNEELLIRPATEDDLPELMAIYNEEVLHGTATFDITAKTLEERRAWLAAHNRDHHPLLVCERSGHVAGYASLSTYREREAFRTTAELSVYVAGEDRGKGVATRLMTELLALARADEGLHLVVSVITSSNEASRKLHERFGFTFCGEIPEVGRKFDQYLGVETYYLRV